jgi:hypothetical protein
MVQTLALDMLRELADQLFTVMDTLLAKHTFRFFTLYTISRCRLECYGRLALLCAHLYGVLASTEHRLNEKRLVKDRLNKVAKWRSRLIRGSYLHICGTHLPMQHALTMIGFGASIWELVHPNIVTRITSCVLTAVLLLYVLEYFVNGVDRNRLKWQLVLMVPLIALIPRQIAISFGGVQQLPLYLLAFYVLLGLRMLTIKSVFPFDVKLLLSFLQECEQTCHVRRESFSGGSSKRKGDLEIRQNNPKQPLLAD